MRWLQTDWTDGVLGKASSSASPSSPDRHALSVEGLPCSARDSSQSGPTSPKPNGALLVPPTEPRDRAIFVLSWLIGLTTLIALVLFSCAQSLRLPANFGIEDWLGWTRHDTLRAAVEVWFEAHAGERIDVHGNGPVPAAVAYLLLDTAVFMPVYGLTLLWATRCIRAALIPATANAQHWTRWTSSLAVPLLAALWICDAFENAGGLVRLGMSPLWVVASLALAASIFWRLRAWTIDSSNRPFMDALLLMLLASSAIVLLAFLLTTGAPRTNWPYGGWAHTGKQVTALLALAPPAALWLCWWFGLDVGSSQNERGIDRGAIRAAYRQVALGIVGRTRYVLGVLALFGILVLVLDQCRDVLLTLVTSNTGLLWVLVVSGSAIGLALLAHSCWLWARLAGRIQRKGYSPPDLDGVDRWAGEFARSWARVLMLMPLLMASFLIANVAGDAVIADRGNSSPGVLLRGQIVLALFATVVLSIAVFLMRRRRRASGLNAADYYNSVDSVRALLHDPYCTPIGSNREQAIKNQNSIDANTVGADTKTNRMVRWGRHSLHWLAHPVWQPLCALGMLFIVRAAMQVFPEHTGQAPPALAVLSLSMVWWLGPLGLIALAEQRMVFPWGLLLLALAGLIGMGSDNHLLPSFATDQVDLVPEDLRSMRLVSLVGIGLLCIASGWLWWVFVAPEKTSKGSSATTQREARRIAQAGAAYLLLCAALLGVDRFMAERLVTPEISKLVALDRVRAPKPLPLDDAPLLLVASEGGSVRAAYWTARVLMAVEQENHGWSDRIVAMSGVSGGSMGFALWRACKRKTEASNDAEMVRCLEDGFRDLDPLSPLLAGLMFEDVWMRFLPSDWVCREGSGCGLRSRALSFEREWMRAFPSLAEPLVIEATAAMPDLLLNTTVVESGNRGVFSTRKFEEDELPGAEDLISSRRVASIPSLITAAHASARFPVTNPLASLPGNGSDRAAAHLIDGGYHDNSGTLSIADVLTYLRANHVMNPVQLVLIRNGQVPTRCLRQALESEQRQPPPNCLKIESNAQELMPPRDSQRLTYFADLFGPVVAALNSLGTGSHGRQAVAALAARIAATATPVEGDGPSVAACSTSVSSSAASTTTATLASENSAKTHLPKEGMGCSASSAVCLLDQVQDASLVPLGWSLSRTARAAMNERAAELASKVAEARAVQSCVAAARAGDRR